MNVIEILLIANRGEIVCRIARTARRMGLRIVAVYADADREALHVAQCDTAVRIGPPEAARSHLDAAAIVAAARAAGAQAIHPGDGFLSESLALIDVCEATGLIFVDPSREAIRRMGSKIESKRIAMEHCVPVVPGYHADDQDGAVLQVAASDVGYPVLIKASVGGGKGMWVVRGAGGFTTALDTVGREAQASFGDDRVLLERYLDEPRHIEVQLLGDKHGNLVHLFERECSIQGNHQKVIEETPKPRLAPARPLAAHAHRRGGRGRVGRQPPACAHAWPGDSGASKPRHGGECGRYTGANGSHENGAHDQRARREPGQRAALSQWRCGARWHVLVVMDIVGN